MKEDLNMMAKCSHGNYYLYLVHNPANLRDPYDLVPVIHQKAKSLNSQKKVIEWEIPEVDNFGTKKQVLPKSINPSLTTSSGQNQMQAIFN